MPILLTGAAGFIGFHTAQALLARGQQVVGLDNLNAYYDPALKEARLAILRQHPDFRFEKGDVADPDRVRAVAAAHPGIGGIIHLAAQAGVRYSLENPLAYIDANVRGQTVMLELARNLPGQPHLVYASSSSVYGGNTKLPFAVGDQVGRPISVYAATKRAAELLSHTYAHLYRQPATGLRFFTVYGPWGRPDMAAWLFADAILEGRPIKVFNHGKMERDFTYVDDIVAGILAALDHVPADEGGEPPHRLYNLGNHRPEKLEDFIGLMEQHLRRPAIRELLPLQPGDVPATFADIEGASRDLGFHPRTPLAEGLPRFLDWYQTWRQRG